MAIKKFIVTIEEVSETEYTVEASNKKAAQNRAIRLWRADHKTPEVKDVTRVKEDVAEEVDEEQA